MKIKTLVATLAVVAATSSVAFADSTVSFQAKASLNLGSPAVVVRDHRTIETCDTHYIAPKPIVTTAAWHQYRPIQPAPRPVFIDNTNGTLYTGSIGYVGHSNAMVALSAPTRFEAGREDFILRQDGFDTLQLRGVSGWTFISKVTVDFQDGIRAQVVNVNRWVAAGQAITLDIKGRDRFVKRVLVYGQSRPGSAYQLFAQ